MPAPDLGLRKRMAVVFIGTALFMAVLLVRVAYIQFIQGEELAKRALDMRTREVPVEAKRGTIYDRRGRELAVSVNVESVFAIPAQIRDAESTAATVATILGMEKDDVLRRITLPSSFVWIKRKIEEDVARQLKAKKLPGIETTQESKRYYPKGNLASHVLGIAGIDNQGLEGVELFYDTPLGGSKGKIIIEFDARGQEMPQALHRYIAPVDGNDAYLTIDEVVQFIAERELEQAMIRHQAKGGVIIVMDPTTGEILAMAVRPDYDPNNYNDYPVQNRRNIAVVDAFSPGSTFKPITAAAALEEGLVKMSDRFFCGGSIKVPGAVISCWSSNHGSLSFLEVIRHSCNVGFVNVGLRVGKEKFYEYVQAFNLTDKTGIDFPGEATGIMLKPDVMKTVDLAVMSFGQTLTVTPLQLITAVAAIANDGKLMRPHLLKEIRSPEGVVVAEQPPEMLRQVISRETARELKEAMRSVVEEGTGRHAYIEGYTVAGKTGTAQKVVEGRIVRGRYTAMFVGFVPYDNPKLIALAMLDEPEGAYYGGQIAAPLWAAVVRDVLQYLEIPPAPKTSTDLKPSAADPADIQVTVPNVVNLTPAEAMSVAREAGVRVFVEGGGPRILQQTPAAGASVKKDTMVIAFTEGEPGGKEQVTVPDLIGKTMRSVAATLAQVGLQMETEGSGLAIEQDPVPGTQVPSGTIVRVRFSP